MRAADPPHAEKLWLAPEPSSKPSDEYVGPMRNRRCACAEDIPASHSAAKSQQVGRMGNGYRARGAGFGDSNHDPSRDGAYLTSNPTMNPATFRRTSHDQKVAFSSGRTLSYHTPLPSVESAMVGSQSIVANSIPARGPPPLAHRPALS